MTSAKFCCGEMRDVREVAARIERPPMAPAAGNPYMGRMAACLREHSLRMGPPTCANAAHRQANRKSK